MATNCTFANSSFLLKDINMYNIELSLSKQTNLIALHNLGRLQTIYIISIWRFQATDKL